MITMKTCWLLLFCAAYTTVKGDIGDYADPTFNCPARTTCPQLCVATVEDCPEGMRCKFGEELCSDGSCAMNCTDIVDNPCSDYTCVPIACPKVDELYTDCTDKYGELYDYAANCTALEAEEEITLLTFREPVFVLLEAWIAGLTGLILLWCFVNQRVAPVLPLSQQTLEDEFHKPKTPSATTPMASATVMSPSKVEIESSTNKVEVENSEMIAETAVAAVINDGQDSDDAMALKKDLSQLKYQTGYNHNIIGELLFLATLLTLASFHVLLFFLTMYYYRQQGNLKHGKVKFQDEEQVLKAYEIVWCVGIFWTFALKWPYSLRALFLRRCALPDATHVSVFCPTPPASSTASLIGTNSGYITQLKLFIATLATLFRDFMALIFSDESRNHPDGIWQYCSVKTDASGARYFFHNFRRFNLDRDSGKFVPGCLTVGETIGDHYSARGGLSSEELFARQSVVGPNSIRMSKPTIWKTMYKQFTSPFYTYQAFMIWSWVPLFYYYMAMVWFFVITSGGLIVCYFEYRNEQNLYKLAFIEGTVDALRDGQRVTVSQKDLVPGDVVVLQPGVTYCDMVLVQSTGLLVDESALTGESTPMAKSAIDPATAGALYDPVTNKKNTIFAGTAVVEAEADVNLAVVTKTGSFTSKGELLRSIFGYERHQFKFDVEVKFVIIILFFYAIFGFAMVIYFIKDTAIFGWFYGIYVVGTTLPPLLPTVFTVSVGISNDRLAKKRIACTKAEGILVAGKVQVAFFDKTGTLTKQGLDFVGCKTREAWGECAATDLSADMALGMAVCHGLTKTHTGIVVGNPVDRTMFESSGAECLSNDGPMVHLKDRNGEVVRVVKHFDFDHSRMTQGVIVQKDSGEMLAFVKGGGESIKSLCDPSTVPQDFDEELRSSSKSGVYQISMAWKSLKTDGSVDLSTITRDQIERDLTFAGVIDFKNMLRDETPDVLLQLYEGDVRPIMITGDNVFTGIRVAKESGLVKEGYSVYLANSIHEDGSISWVNEQDEVVELQSLDQLNTTSGISLAMIGSVWTSILANDPNTARQLVGLVQIFGRCTPPDKAAIVGTFVDLGYVTLMCGDGGNDCGALKTAHVGVALSDSEASVVAPFTSLDKTITSVVEVLKEGRCALASALASYKFIILYGQVETINQLLNAYFQVTFTEWCWVFMDGVWTVTLAFTLPLAKAESRLSRSRPTSALLGPQTLASAVGILLIHFSFTVIGLFLLFGQPWFQCRKWDSIDVSSVIVIGDNFETQTIFLITGAQYITSAFVLNFGYEFRQAFYKNYLFNALVLGYAIMHLFIIIQPGKLSCFWRINCDNDHLVRGVTTKGLMPIQNPFNTTVMPEDYRWKIVGIIIGNTVAIMIWEYLIVNGIRRRMAQKKWEKKTLPYTPEPEPEGF